MELNHALKKILDNNECFVHFLDFLDANRCSESVFFWRDCELYASLFKDLYREKENGNDEEFKRVERSIEAKANDIYEIYFSDHSPYLINIEGKISKEIMDKFKRGTRPSADPNLFKKAQKAIFTLMKLDSFPRFLQSPYYDNMLRSIEQKDPSRFAALNFSPRSSTSDVPNSPKKEKHHENFEMSTIGKSVGLNKIINKMKSTKIKVPKPHLSFSSNNSTAYSSEQSLETTFNPREVVLTNKEIAEMKVFIDQSVTKLVVGAENESRVDLTLLLSDQDCDKLNHNFKTEAGRRYFADVLNRLRSSKSIPSAGFEILWRLIKVALINSDYYSDYCSAKMLMHMAATYFREVNGIRDYVYTRLKSIELWHKTRYWEFALYDAVANERDKVKITIKEWNKLSSEDRADRVASERGIFFGQLGSFAMHMLSVGLDVDSVRSFISKQCLVNALSEDQRDTLIGALPSMMHAVEESEKERSKIVDLNINSPMPNKKTTVQENPIQEKREQFIKKKLAFEKQVQTLDTLISLCDELKDPSWEERNVKITEQMINQGFDELRKMLDEKQKELLSNLREKSQETMEELASNANEMRENKKKTLEAVSAIEHILELKVPEAFALAVSETEKKLDEHLLNSFKEKPNQLIVNDYSFYVSFDKIKSEISRLHTNDKLSVARWKVKNYSNSVSREVSSLFRLYGFNWRLVLHPPSTEEKLSLYLEFMDSTTAVSWQLSVKFLLRIINQKNIMVSKSSEVLSYAFGVDSKKCGFSEFLSNEELEESDNGWILEDAVLVEVELLELDILEENVTENV